MELIALNPTELQTAHSEMERWCQNQICLCQSMLTKWQEALNSATASGWKKDTIRRQVKKYERGKEFFQKIGVALRAGYMIIPNFNMTVFAIRTTKASPGGTSLHTHDAVRHEQKGSLLPVEIGEYVSPVPEIHRAFDKGKDSQGRDYSHPLSWPIGWKSISFPIALARPVVMNQTAQAMALKAFDEVGIAHDTNWRASTKGDPVVIGRILCPFGTRKAMSFFIAWGFDTRSLEVPV